MNPGKFENIFIVSSGRTATTAMAKACAHLEGYSADHESRARRPFAERLNYPKWHIEADNRLLFFLMQLEDKYGDNALYIYLERDAEAVAKSYAGRWHLTVSIVRTFTHGIKMASRVTKPDIIDHCRDFVNYSDDSFRRFLSRRSNVVFMDVSDLEGEFPKLCDALGVATPEKSLEELRIRHNTNYKNTFMVRLKTWIRLKMP